MFSYNLYDAEARKIWKFISQSFWYWNNDCNYFLTWYGNQRREQYDVLRAVSRFGGTLRWDTCLLNLSQKIRGLTRPRLMEDDFFCGLEDGGWFFWWSEGWFFVWSGWIFFWDDFFNDAEVDFLGDNTRFAVFVLSFIRSIFIFIKPKFIFLSWIWILFDFAS